MSEYIYATIGDPVANALGEIFLPRCEVVRCGDCANYYEAENYHPNGNYYSRCCKYFDTYNNEVEPDGFCAWAERRDA